jgi:hypothetical protein
MLTSAIQRTQVISTYNILAGDPGNSGSNDGTGTAARFNAPLNMVYDGAHNLYVADVGNNAIRKITPAGVVTYYAGSGASGSADGNGTSATFSAPGGVAIDASSNVYVGDTTNGLVRKITPARDVTTLSFPVPTARSLAVSPNGSNILAINLTSSNVYYYLNGVSAGQATSGATYPLTTSVACRPDGTFYRTPSSSGNGDTVPMLLRVSAALGTSNQTTTGNVTTTRVGGTTVHTVSMTISGTNNFATGSVVSFSGFTPSLLNLTGITLGAGTTTGLGGTIQYTHDFGQNLDATYNTQGTVSKPTLTETQTVVMIDGDSYGGTYFSHISFQSDTSFCGMTTGGDLVKYTLASDVATQNQTAEPGEPSPLFAVKSSNPLEFAYGGTTSDNAVYIYNKKY